MNPKNRYLVNVSVFGMELSWTYAWAVFVFMAVFQRPFPLSAAIITSALALALTSLPAGRGWRWIWVIFIQCTGFCLAGLWAVYAVEKPPLSFFDTTWVVAFFAAPKAVMQWAMIYLTVFWTLGFWISGNLQAHRPDTYEAISNHFDLGAGALLFLLLTEMTLLIKGVSVQALNLTAIRLFPFFIFSVMAFSLARNRSDGRKDFVTGYQGISTIVSFTVVVLLLGTAMVSFLLPYMTLTAEASYQVLKTVGRPLGHILLTVVRFLFGARPLKPEPSKPAGPVQDGMEDVVPGRDGGWLESMMVILGWLLLAVAIAAALFVIAWLLWKLLKVLLSRTETRTRQTKNFWSTFFLWLLEIPSLVLAFLARMRTWFNRPRTAVQVYLALMAWGRRSGMPPMLSDTPLEYGDRLGRRFPAVSLEIRCIVTTHNRAVYGRKAGATSGRANSDESDGMKAAKSALGKLRTPRLWPARLRSRILPTGGRTFSA